jgi:hypothetical protein
MHTTTAITCLCFAAASLSAQGFVTLPSTANPAAELGSYSLLPLTRPDARIQVFYDEAEVGSAPFVATELALRYDGPIPAVGVPGPFTITRLQIRLGVSSIVNPGADFAGNLTQPLTSVFDGPPPRASGSWSRCRWRAIRSRSRDSRTRCSTAR